MTTVHLLPLADIATVDEDKSTWQIAGLRPGRRSRRTATSSRPASKPTVEQGRLQLGLRPAALHDPGRVLLDRPERARPAPGEFRDMVTALNDNGQRVVMDVVYNHTTDSGQTGTQRPGPDRARLLPPARRRGDGRDLHLLRRTPPPSTR